ncbi:hypothetical protein IGW14_32820 [Streptomyces hygroscopicus subsp. hygroscopicus]|uniref:hypothetical protein n=1 Tax=Streptomyces hygroscopicus TaxID=1912 RepID=UPI001C65A8E7|nr:hypothetical protein [Streptomyces hygroscopicus]MBW8092625.1 hypothetical protein [Streptomyces hygroscopicus subsp. hygroscopicus]
MAADVVFIDLSLSSRPGALLLSAPGSPSSEAGPGPNTLERMSRTGGARRGGSPRMGRVNGSGPHRYAVASWGGPIVSMSTCPMAARARRPSVHVRP